MSTNENTQLYEQVYDDTYDTITDVIDRALGEEIIQISNKAEFIGALLDQVSNKYADINNE
jgi:hypothetical protein